MKRDIELEATLVAKYAVVASVLDERSRRRWAAADSLAIGCGGDAVVSSATGLARETIRKGRREIARDEAPTDRIGRPGGTPASARRREAVSKTLRREPDQGTEGPADRPHELPEVRTEPVGPRGAVDLLAEEARRAA